MKKLFITSCMVLSLMVLPFANADAGRRGPAPCSGPDCTQSGKIDMEVFAAGGAIDGYGSLITKGGGISGAAGTIAGAGGVGAGTAKGGSFFGKVDGKIGVTAGGIIIGDAGNYTPSGFDKSIGVFSWGHGEAAAGGYLELTALGFSGASGAFGAVAGEGTLSGSIVGPSPKSFWNTEGVSYGVAGQGAAGYVSGGATVLLLGHADLGGLVYMSGNSGSESYRGWENLGDGYTRETMGTNVFANTNVTSDVNEEFCGLAFGGIDGGYVVAGGATTTTIQTVEGGVGYANASGSYSGAGELGCNFGGALEGGTRTSITTLNGGKGAIVSSQAQMSVQVTNHPIVPEL